MIGKQHDQQTSWFCPHMNGRMEPTILIATINNPNMSQVGTKTSNM